MISSTSAWAWTDREGYDKQDRLEARLGGKSGTPKLISLTVEEGPRVLLNFTAMRPPRKVRRQVRNLWRDGVFDGQRLDVRPPSA